jgi:CTP synthase
VSTKYIFVTGGVVSSLGKGIAAASVGRLLMSRGLSVELMKLDPYINVDPGTMNPYQHGEVYVTDDGAETDLDLGHYERFTGTVTGKLSNVTTGMIYNTVITKEREGAFLGATVQVIPHITNEIKRRILDLAQAKEPDVLIVEVGGTVGDIEGLPFLEAIRQFWLDVGRKNAIFIHLTLVPFLENVGELKTKPTQHSVRALREIGIQPDILICRTSRNLPLSLRKKIALFCNVDLNAVIEAPDTDTIYSVPMKFLDEGLDEIIVELLRLDCDLPRLNEWKMMLETVRHPAYQVDIAIVGKYTTLKDSYKSILEAFVHAGVANDCRVKLHWIESDKLGTESIFHTLSQVTGILVPGGFGSRGIDGMVSAVKFVRENDIPFFGICLGLQCAVIEFARNVLGFDGANSTEFDKNTIYPVISLLEEQKKVSLMGATMRLGAYPCQLVGGSTAKEAYGKKLISERHRHRYEFNNEFKDGFEQAGMLMSGICPDNDLVEIIEIPKNRWFVGVQFHPELKSQPLAPHPLFKSFVAHALALARERKDEGISSDVDAVKSSTAQRD